MRLSITFNSSRCGFGWGNFCDGKYVMDNNFTMQEKTLNYNYTVDPNSDTAAANVLRFVGKQKKVLEIGAGPGSILRVLQDINQCNITAIEIHPDYIEELKQFCSSVISADLNNPQWYKIFSEEQKFDVVVAADVLEHLYDPLRCLQNIKNLLNDSGYIVISLPHAGHAVISGCLWNGDFQYSESGLLDKNHIRFFGIKNIQKLIEDADLKIIDASFVVRSPDQTELADLWLSLPHGLKKELLSNPFACVYQVVLHVVPETYTGSPIKLTEIPVPSAQIIPFGIFNQTYVLTGLFRKVVRQVLSQNQKKKLQSYLRTWGVHV
jgi:2-polyprenyl-3-methyl-5-hydroxy-6-metoxy-1,4-benzoquinol methylase